MKFIKRVISDSGLNEKMVELLEYEFVDRKPTKIYVLDSVLAIQSSFALELYIPFNAIKTYTEYYVTNYKEREEKNDDKL